MSTIFHPAVETWFATHFPAPTEPQARAWPLIQRGENVLIAAPTGSGKTLAAFLSAIDALVREGLERGLADETLVVYVSPLKALSNDVQKNLAVPIKGIRDQLRAQGLPDVEIRTLVRTGDTPQHERVSMRKRPPHIVVTTPESLYVLLGSESGRGMLATTRTVIVDEIHALASNKRGSHLALSLARLAALTGRPLARIGLSATQKPIEEIARFLVGAPAGAAQRVSPTGRPEGEHPSAEHECRQTSGPTGRPEGEHPSAEQERRPISRKRWGITSRRARSSTRGTCGRATSRSTCRRRRSKRSCRTKYGRRSMPVLPTWSRSIAPRSCS